MLPASFRPKRSAGVLGVMENIGSGLVDGHRTGIGDGIGLLLADVQLKGLKMQFTLAHDKILISVLFLFFVKEKPGVVLVQLPGRICSAAPTLQAVQSIAPRRTAFARELGIRPQRKF